MKRKREETTTQEEEDEDTVQEEEAVVELKDEENSSEDDDDFALLDDDLILKEEINDDDEENAIPFPLDQELSQYASQLLDDAENEKKKQQNTLFMQEDDDENDLKPKAKRQKRTTDTKEANIWYMSEKRVPLAQIPQGLFCKSLQRALAECKIAELFAVQRAVIPSVIAMHKSHTPGDICISSPTGSGKTLAYVVPIQECLHMYATSKKLRALVIVPTQNLAEQVHDVFCKFEQFTGVRAGLAHGAVHATKELNKLRHKQTGAWLVDVVVGTPGRLLFHIQSSAGFGLEHLQFLVLDEVDKLLLEQSIDSTRTLMQSYFDNPLIQQQQKKIVQTDVPFPSPYQFVRKILCSATLTVTTAKLDRILLHRPQFFTYSQPDSEKKYTLPKSLEQQMVLYESQYKPLYLLHMLVTQPYEKIIVFCQKNEIAERLYRFLRITKLVSVALYSKSTSAASMNESLRAFKKGHMRTLICSDAMSRGMDVDTDCVINYDMPLYLKTYVHRVGRTARANRAGMSFTLVRKEQVGDLRDKLNKVDGNEMSEHFVSMERDLAKYMGKYKQYLVELEQELSKIKK